MNEHMRARLIAEAEDELARTITSMVGWQVELGHVEPDRAQDTIERNMRDALEIAQSTTDLSPRIPLHITLEAVTDAYQRRANTLHTQVLAKRTENQ